MYTATVKTWLATNPVVWDLILLWHLTNYHTDCEFPRFLSNNLQSICKICEVSGAIQNTHDFSIILGYVRAKVYWTWNVKWHHHWPLRSQILTIKHHIFQTQENSVEHEEAHSVKRFILFLFLYLTRWMSHSVSHDISCVLGKGSEGESVFAYGNVCKYYNAYMTVVHVTVCFSSQKMLYQMTMWWFREGSPEYAAPLGMTEFYSEFQQNLLSQVQCASGRLLK